MRSSVNGLRRVVSCFKWLSVSDCLPSFNVKHSIFCCWKHAVAAFVGRRQSREQSGFLESRNVVICLFCSHGDIARLKRPRLSSPMARHSVCGELARTSRAPSSPNSPPKTNSHNDDVPCLRLRLPHPANSQHLPPAPAEVPLRRPCRQYASHTPSQHRVSPPHTPLPPAHTGRQQSHARTCCTSGPPPPQWLLSWVAPPAGFQGGVPCRKPGALSGGINGLGRLRLRALRLKRTPVGRNTVCCPSTSPPSVIGGWASWPEQMPCPSPWSPTWIVLQKQVLLLASSVKSKIAASSTTCLRTSCRNRSPATTLQGFEQTRQPFADPFTRFSRTFLSGISAPTDKIHKERRLIG